MWMRKALYPHIPRARVSRAGLWYASCTQIGGIRSCGESGSVMFGKYDAKRRFVPAAQELVRLAIPRRVYTQSHMDYVVETFRELMTERDQAPGYRIAYEPPFLRHFTARFEPIR
jgi:tyrosine phenol-lyase